MSRAVLVIDVQRSLCEGEYETFDAAGVIGRINDVTAKARAANALVVIIQHESKDGLLIYGSRGWGARPSNCRPVRRTPSFGRPLPTRFIARNSMRS